MGSVNLMMSVVGACLAWCVGPSANWAALCPWWPGDERRAPWCVAWLHAPSRPEL